MIFFEYVIQRDPLGYLTYTRLKSNNQTVIVGNGRYTTLWSARRGIRRIMKLLDKSVVVINVGSL